MKKWHKILLGVVGFIVVAVGTGFYFTSGVVDVADAFFKAVQQKDMAKAHSYLARDFKAIADEKTLAVHLSRNSLSSYKEASWSSRQVSGDRGELVGTITTTAGGSVPVKMILVKENDAWKIYAIQKPTAGMEAEKSSPTIPSKADQTSLVKQSTYNFVISVSKKDMGHFRSTISNLWQRQFTTEQLNQSYKAVTDSGADWSVLNNLDPVFATDASIDKDGVLIINGYYPTTPSRVYVVQKYVNEGGTWKLIGLHLQVKRE